MIDNKYQNIRVKMDNAIIEEARQATKAIGEEAAMRGISDMSMDDIDAVIAASRKEKKAKQTEYFMIRRRARGHGQ